MTLAVNLPLLREPAEVIVTGVCGHGWFSSIMSLRGFAKARPQLERFDVLFVEVVGSLL
ncbi:hypothetical protein ABL849_22865 [Variovorax sp. 375MFSha3.1]|uniref:hypothetical protein n=1 Tax=Variovorax sp. 375MFSha3.1 TaxID=3158364 RepID=UPI003AAFFA89